MKVIWLTDIHLNFLDDRGRRAFFESVSGSEPDAVLISGDIAVGPTVERYLVQFADVLSCPLYFVLGNHDFWESGFDEQRRNMAALNERSPKLQWMGNGQIIPLTDGVGLIGHDGWYDGRAGDYENSTIKLNDFFRIRDFAYKGKVQLLTFLNALGDEMADYFAELLPRALARFENVILLTHVPPFPEAALYRGAMTNDDWLPFMSSEVVGEALRDVMARHPDGHLTVLCGHTHGAGEVLIAENLTVRVGGAEYGHPELQFPILLSPRP